MRAQEGALAESEIFSAIADGELDHDALTASWMLGLASGILENPEPERALDV